MLTIRHLLTVCLFFASGLPAFTQFKAFEPGELGKKELETPRWEQDIEAGALILHDIGRTRFVGGENGWQLLFRRHLVIKIFDKSAYEAANIRIPLSIYDGGIEQIKTLEAYSYNLEGNKVMKSRLSDEDWFIEDYSEHRKMGRVAFPNVTEGSVIELVYSIRSDFLFNLQPWQFQDQIPTLHSGYGISIPAYFDYKVMEVGYYPYSDQKVSVKKEKFFFGGGQTAEIDCSQFYWEMKDVPAFEDEPYMTAPQDYIAGIRFELSSLTVPGRAPQQFMKDWAAFSDELMQSESFGKRIRRTGTMKSQVEEIVKGKVGMEEKAQAIYDHLKERMNWNGDFGYYCDRNPLEIYNSGEGATGELSVLLAAMLREADVDAYPVLLSTRMHGKVIKDFPIASRFNYCMVAMPFGNNFKLMDITDPYRGIGELPYACLNGEAVVLKPGGVKWVDIGKDHQFLTMTSGFLSISAEGEVSGNVNLSEGGVNGWAVRMAEEDYETEVEGYEVEVSGVENLEVAGEKVEFTLGVKSTEVVTVAGDKMYFSPLSGWGRTRNPFSAGDRVYPIDLGARLKEAISLTFTLPEGYEVLELPEQVNMGLPDGAGKFRFLVHAQGNSLQVISSLSLEETLFAPNYLDALKELFSAVVKCHEAQVVLQKKS